METNNQFEQLNKKLDLIIFFLKIQNRGNLAKDINSYFDSDQKIEVYELTDGENSTRQIYDLTGVSKDTVSKYWRDWLSVGFVIPGPKRDDRPIKIFPKKEILEIKKRNTQ